MEVLSLQELSNVTGGHWHRKKRPHYGGWYRQTTPRGYCDNVIVYGSYNRIVLFC